MRIKSLLIENEFYRFVFTGGIAALVNFTSRIILNLYFTYSTSIVIAYLFGMLTAFILSKKYVFKPSSHFVLMSFFYFSVVNILAVLQTWLLAMSFNYHILPYFGIISYTRELSHMVGIVIPVFTSYYGHKYLSFRS